MTGAHQPSRFVLPDAQHVRVLLRLLCDDTNCEVLWHLGDGPLELATLADHTGKPLDSLRGSLERLRAAGLVEPHGREKRLYRLTDAVAVRRGPQESTLTVMTTGGSRITVGTGR